MGRNGLSAEQLMLVLDAIPEIVYITDMDTYEILFANKTLERALGEDPTGKTCFEAFQGKEAPCSFCTNDQLKKKEYSGPLVWEHYNAKMKRHFKCIDQTLTWTDGRVVRLELAVDITDIKATEERREILDNIRELRLVVGELKDAKMV